MNDVVVMVGGIVPDEDAAQLKRLGVAPCFNPALRSKGLWNSSAAR